MNKINLRLKYPINYDFGKNWETKIVPYLDDSIIIESLKALQASWLAPEEIYHVIRTHEIIPPCEMARQVFRSEIQNRHIDHLRSIGKYSGNFWKSKIDLK
uniref:Uncharacterized protein n=1 Tax=viral metagenome TaxID=1070528 RepID=A0A6C0BKQ5_9ZZZZ